MKINYLEVCAGAGGLSLGFEKACEELGIESSHTCIEILKPQCETLRHNRPDWKVLQEDMTQCYDEISTEEFMNKHDIKDIDILAGGIPCQSFSIVGQQKGMDDPRGQLIYNFGEMAKYLKPKILLIENVKNLVYINKGAVLEFFKNFIEELGYIFYYKVLNSNDFEVAQARERVIMIGIRKDIHNETFEYPEPLEKKLVIKDILEDIKNNVNKGQLPNPKEGTIIANSMKEFSDTYILAENVDKRIKHAYGSRKFNKLGLKEPSLTLLAIPDGNFFVFMHWIEHRRLSVSEYATIQSFPPYYEFKGTVRNQYHQIGNAVPVNLGKHIYLSVLKYLKSSSRKLI